MAVSRERNRPWWALFDLDETLYPADTGLMEAIRGRMDEYMVQRLHLDESTARELRMRYRQQYGTTMRGLLVEYHIDAEPYLAYVHDVPLDRFLQPNPALDRILADLPWRKVIFTSAPREHAQAVLRVLGIAPNFERILDVRDAGLLGKAYRSTFESVIQELGVSAQQCIMLDDFVQNLIPANALGMKTVLVGSSDKPDGVDFAIARIEDVARVAAAL